MTPWKLSAVCQVRHLTGGLEGDQIVAFIKRVVRHLTGGLEVQRFKHGAVLWVRHLTGGLEDGR